MAYGKNGLPSRFAAVQVVENPVSLGLGAVDDGMLGLFDLVTDTNLRQNGLATRVVNALFGTLSARLVGQLKAEGYRSGLQTILQVLDAERDLYAAIIRAGNIQAD